MLERNDIDLFYLLESAERNKKYIPVRVGLTNGLIGHRVLLIPKGNNPVFENVNSLIDFRNLGLICGMGMNWFDVKVWELNKLKVYKQDGDYRLIFNMLAVKNRGIDYFSTGFNEAGAELKEYANSVPGYPLEIEKRLMLVYDRDFFFYLSKKAAKYKDIIETSLIKAKEIGLIDKKIRKYWANDFKNLNFDKRLKIHLKTPK